MGVLAGFFEDEKRESNPARVANPAKVSSFSDFSSHRITETQSASACRAPETHFCEVCGAPAMLGVDCFPTRGVVGRWYCSACFPAPKGRA